MSELPDIEDLYPNLVRIKHKDDPWGLTLKIMKWLEGRKIMVNQDFFLDARGDPERILVHFRKAKNAKLFKDNKKKIRDAEAPATGASLDIAED